MASDFALRVASMVAAGRRLLRLLIAAMFHPCLCLDVIVAAEV